MEKKCHKRKQETKVFSINLINGILKKDKGTVEYTLSIMMVMLMIFLILFSYRMRIVKVSKENVDDALVSSNLAGAVIDLKEFGTTNEILIKDPQSSYILYQEALKGNLNLKEDFTPRSTKLINSRVIIHDFIIYNVLQGSVRMIRLGSDGGIISEQNYPGGAGNIQTPDGTTVNSTTIYSKIGFEIKSYDEQLMYVYKQNSVDVVLNE